MAERRKLMELEIIVDDDCGMYKMGEIDTLVAPHIEKYIHVYGETAYEEIKELCSSMLQSARDSIIRKRMANTGENQAYQGS